MNELPQGWSTTTIEEIGVPPGTTIDPSQHRDEEFELFSVPSYSAGQPEIMMGGDVGSTKQVVQPDDVLVCKIVPHINRVWIVPTSQGYRQIASSEWIIIRNPHLNARYLRNCFAGPGFRTEFLKDLTGIGGSLTRARPENVRKICVPIAPLVEQRRIAVKLDSLFARTKAARDELARIALLVEHYKQAILTSFYDRSVSLAAKNLALDEIALEIRTGLSRRPEHNPPGVPILKISAIRPMMVRLEERRFYKLYDGEDIARYYLREGDLLFTRYNGNPALVANCGMLRYVDGDLVYPDKIIRVRVNTDLASPAFIEAVAATPQIRYQLEPYIKSAAGQHGISGQDLRRLPIPIPALHIQQEMTANLHEALKATLAFSTDAAKARALLDRMDQSLLTKAFRGELVAQDLNDEPADKLLERIRAAREAGAKPRRGRPMKERT